jgi:hypothetical protein
MTTKRNLAWHFVGDRLRNGDPVPKDGVLLRIEPPIEMCKRGLHASRRPFDALQYAPGNTLCLVEVGGEIIEGDDKLVCTERKIIVRMDAEPLLRYFARMQALSVTHLWDTPDVVFEYLMTGAEPIRSAAYSAAYSAAKSAAYSAAYFAAYFAAYSAAKDDFNKLVYEYFEDWL